MNLAMKVVQRVVGVQAHIIAKNFPKQSAVQIVMVGGVLDLNQMNVVIHFVLEAVLDLPPRVYILGCLKSGILNTCG